MIATRILIDYFEYKTSNTRWIIIIVRYDLYSVSGIDGGALRGKSRGTLTSTAPDDHRMGIAEINENAKIRYFDGSGDDVTPVPLFVPPEPEDEEKMEGDDDSKKKPRKNVIQTFLKVWYNYENSDIYIVN